MTFVIKYDVSFWKGTMVFCVFLSMLTNEKV